MIELTDVLEIHQILISTFGGLPGVRDQGLLVSALERPLGGVGDSPFYPEPEQKAGALLESIVRNHPFVDGNKRTGYVLMRLLLMQQGKDMVATQDEKYEFVIRVASGQLTFEQIVDWIRSKTT